LGDGKPAGLHPLAPYLVLGIALLAVSHAAIFARLADAAPLAIAACASGVRRQGECRMASARTRPGASWVMRRAIIPPNENPTTAAPGRRQ